MKKIFALIVSAALILSGCAEKKDSGKMQVYTSFYAMYDFAKLIGGDRADIYVLCPVGAEPHEFEPKTSDMAKLAEADVFIYNGMGMESWAQKTAQSVNNPELAVVEASKDIPFTSEDYDAHVWLDPDNALKEMENIKNAFCEKDGANADYYTANFDNCREKAKKLTDDFNAASKNFKTNNIVVSHAAFSYLCSAFNLNQTSIEGPQGESDPSPAKMAETIDFIKTNNIKYIFSEALSSSKTLDSIAKETGAEILVLNPFEGDSEERDYFTVMEENLNSLKKALD